MIKLDQFYTNPKIIDNLLINIIKKLVKADIQPEKLKWIEPSAGTGNFIDVLKHRYKSIKVVGYDIEPKNNPTIIQADFLLLNSPYSEKNIIFGNPPFGRRSEKAILFINKGFEVSDIVCFILPNQFNRFNTQKKINQDAKLIYQKNIEKNAFLVNDREYNVNCIFQIWVKKTREEFKIFKDYRIHKAPVIRDKDLITYIHNNTIETRKYFNKDKYQWDFALHRQGYYNYEMIFKNESELIQNRQYLFIKCNNDNCKEIITFMNLKKISESNTSVPGYSLGDFIAEYKRTRKKQRNYNNLNKLL